MDPATELPFRILTAVLLILGTVIRVYYQRKTAGVARTISEYDRKDKSPRALPTYAYFPAVLYIFTPWMDFAHLPLPLWLRWLGVLVFCAGSVLFAWTHHALGVNWSGKLALADGHVLVTSGPYRYVRHPMYTAFFLNAIGYLLLTANWLIGPLPLLADIWMYLARVDAEEAMMTEQFGDAYRDYMQRTGRLLPKL